MEPWDEAITFSQFVFECRVHRLVFTKLSAYQASNPKHFDYSGFPGEGEGRTATMFNMGCRMGQYASDVNQDASPISDSNILYWTLI